MQHLTSFEKYLVSMPEDEATLYVLHCLKNGDLNNDAWGLMSEFNGHDWKCAPEEMQKFVLKTIISLRLKAITISAVHR